MLCPFCGCENITGADSCEGCQADLTYLDAPAPQTPIEKSIMEESLRAVASVKPLTVGPETPLREVIGRLTEGDGAALVVFDKALVGIFSERDLLMKIGDRYGELADQPIRDFMTPAPETLGGGDPIAFALNRMDVGDFRHIPIEENEVPVGMVSIRDILRHLATRYPDEIHARP